jgi:hypothetical protein
VKLFQTLAAGIALGALSVLGTAAAHAQSQFASGFGDISRPTPAVTKAQFKLPFGMSSKRVRRTLERDGYSEIEVTYLGIIDAKAEACKDGIKYKIKLRVNGSYEYRNEIGKCRRVVEFKDLRDILRNEGFRRIDIRDDGRLPYAATACRRGDRYALKINEYGEVNVGRRIGSCDNSFADALSPRDLRRALRKDGYDRIKFTDRTRRRFIVEACRNDRRIRLRINRRGRVRDRERIGRCPPRIEARALPGMLRKDGFNRIEVVATKPVYRIEACNRNDDRVRISISPWGERLNQRKIGQCAPPATIASLTEQLKASDKKFRRIRVRRASSTEYPFVATVCDNGERRDLFFSRYGKFERKQDRGACVSRTVAKIIEKLRERGLRDVNIYVEACNPRRNRRVRITLDRYGDPQSRERFGRCR